MERIVTADDQYNFVQNAINRGDVELLVLLWAEAAYSGEIGKQTREQITSALPTLTQELGITESKTFREFVEAYDKKNYYAQCKKRPSDCLNLFASRGDWRNVRLCIKYNNSNLNWNKGLAGAARGGHWDLVEFFLAKGARLFESAFLSAVRGGHWDLIQFFIEKGKFSSLGGLAAAVEGGHRHLVDFFLTKDVYNFDYALAIAARQGNWELVHLFIEKGSENWGWALESAAHGGHLDLIEFFLAKGAELSWGFKGAAGAGRRDIMDLFIQKGYKDIGAGLFDAVIGQHVDIVKFTLTDEKISGYVPLLSAVRSGNSEIVDLILQNDYAMLNYQDVWPQAFKAAVEGGHLNMVKYFVNHYKIENWESGLSIAARHGYPDLILYFIEKGAKDWNKALVAAYETGEDWLISFFIRKGADDWDKMMAIAVDNDKLFNYAISKGADDWDEGLRHAVRKRNMQRIKYFLARGADPTIGLEAAVEMNNQELTTLFRAFIDSEESSSESEEL